jgi:hypothetical protein
MTQASQTEHSIPLPAISFVHSELSEADRQTLLKAFDYLEHTSFAVKLTNVVGTPIEMALKLLPSRWYRRLHRAAEASVDLALRLIISRKLSYSGVSGPSNLGHKILGMAAGAVGGLIGGPALLLELPITTALMLSSIAEIARREGEDLSSLDTRLACMAVFALGGRTDEDDAADTGYYGLRLALEAPIAEASRYLAQLGRSGVAKPPALVQLVSSISRRFGVVISEKAAAEMIPLLGAAGGAVINNMFIEHFQNVAQGHFSLRRLERKYSHALIKEHYNQIKHKNGYFPILAAYGPGNLPS